MRDAQIPLPTQLHWTAAPTTVRTRWHRHDAEPFRNTNLPLRGATQHTYTSPVAGVAKALRA